jgi:hypothetical protein
VTLPSSAEGGIVSPLAILRPAYLLVWPGVTSEGGSMLLLLLL